MFYKKFGKIWVIRITAHETYISTQQSAPGPHPRLFEPHEHPGRAAGIETPPGQGPQAPDRLRAGELT